MSETYSNTAANVAPPAPSVPKTLDMHRRSSATFGVVLIVLGAAFMAAQFIPTVNWWEVWPLVIVVIGLAQAFTPTHRGEWGLDRVSDGLGTAFIGALLLGNTTGYIPWQMWVTFISLWPVLLIAAGIGIIGKATSQGWIRSLAPLVVWATLAYSAYSAVTGYVLFPHELVFYVQ